MIFRIFFIFYLAISFKYSAATTFTTTQDGEWEDSTSWNNIQATNDTLYGDTIIIIHHINFNSNRVFINCYVQIDTPGSICGHDTVWFDYSTIYIYGGFYADVVYGESSSWFAHYARWLVTYLIHWGGMSHFQLILCPLARVGGCFICTIPVQLCPDTIQTDTIQTDTTIIPPPKPPISISVYPNPSLDHFTIDSEVPDSNSQVTLNIYDLLGRKMKTISIPAGKSSLTIFTNNWAAGMYLLRFEQGETIIQTDKIVRIQ